MEMSCQFHDPAALSPVPTGSEAGWAPEPVCKLWKAEEKQMTAHTVARHYTDRAIPTPPPPR
jgi:hypothetical protein